MIMYKSSILAHSDILMAHVVMCPINMLAVNIYYRIYAINTMVHRRRQIKGLISTTRDQCITVKGRQCLQSHAKQGLKCSVSHRSL